MNERRMVPLNWTEIDKLRFKAHWLNDQSFVVEQFLANVRRGSWQFSYLKENMWECVKATHHLYRGGPNDVTGRPIPQHVENYAKWFLLVKTKFTVPNYAVQTITGIEVNAG